MFMTKSLFLLLFLFCIGAAKAEVDCSKHKIYCKIKDLKPSMDNSYAMKLSNLLYKYSIKYNGSPKLAVAIAMQETSLRYDKNRKQRVIQFFEQCDSQGNCHESYRVIDGVSDVCMFQFHVNTILNHNMDPVRLKNDIEYCVEWHFKLMAEKKKICKDMNKPWACYHSKTKTHRVKYIELVERYL